MSSQENTSCPLSHSKRPRSSHTSRCRGATATAKHFVSALLLLLQFQAPDSEAFQQKPIAPGFFLTKKNAFSNTPQTSILASSVASSKTCTLHHNSDLEFDEGGKQMTTKRKQALLSLEETDELLHQALELRRIRNLESELSMTDGGENDSMDDTIAPTPFRSLPPDLRQQLPVSLQKHLCLQAGYGRDLQAFQDAVDIGQRARETLITRNMGLVHSCVRDTLRKSGRSLVMMNLSVEDLIQEGAIGLARAVDRWNPEIGGVFSTYAYYWVRGCVLRAIATQEELVRVPEHVSDAVRKVTQAELFFDNNNNEKAGAGNGAFLVDDFVSKTFDDIQALAKLAGLTDRQVEQALLVKQRRKRGGVISFESWMQQGRNFEADLSEEKSSPTTRTSTSTNDEQLATSSLSSSTETIEYLKDTLSRYLRPKEMEALSWRYGLITETNTIMKNSLQQQKKESSARNAGASASQQHQYYNQLPVRGKWGEAMSFTEVGNKMQVSAEYGRRLCHAALAKLRQAAEEGFLEPALLC